MDLDLLQLAATSPWAAYDPATVSFCEERLSGWVAEPANAFTSLTKTVAGIAVLASCWKRGFDSLALVGLVACYMGFGGFSLHATGTFWGEVLDVTGMFLLSGLFLAFNLRRLFRWSDGRQAAFYALLTAVSLSLLLTIRPSGIPLFTLHLLGWAALEWKLYKTQGEQVDYRYLRWLVGTFLVAFGVWILDVLCILCDPQNHIFQGHAVWHILTSVCVWQFYCFHTQFTEDAQQTA